MKSLLRLCQWTVIIIAFAMCRWTHAAPATAAAPSTPSGQSLPEEPVENGSPRATVGAYLSLCRAGSYDMAARYLDVPKARVADGPRLAKQLKAVLDRHAWIDLESLSPQEHGKLDDGLPQAYEAVAKVPVGAGRSDSVRLFRRGAVDADSPSWVFSRSTVEHIDGWYSHLEQRWPLEHLPAWMLRSGPRELLVWQWLALPLVMALSLLVGALLGAAIRRVFARIALRTTTSWDDALAAKLGGPIAVVVALSLLHLSVPALGLYAPALEFVRSLVRGGSYFVAFWVASRLIDVWGSTVLASPWALEHGTAKSLIPIGLRLGKIAILVIAVVAFVSAMGYPAASLLAGLGVGGLAVALAAQKTIENLFGAFTLGFDQPFRVGDFVKIEDFMGHVEAIGLRSTKIRTLERTMITIPNGKLSEMRLESFAVRDRIRFACNLGLAYGTTSVQLRKVVSDIESLLQQHPKAWPENQVVKLKELGDSALVIEIVAWFMTSDFAEFQGIRQEVLLSILAIVEQAKASIAFPSRTVYLSNSH